MTTEFIDIGDTIVHTPASDIGAGDVVVLNNLIGISAMPIPANRAGVLTITGAFDISKSGESFNAGELLFWDDTSKEVTLDPDGMNNKFIGLAALPAAALDSIGRVLLSHRQEGFPTFGMLFFVDPNEITDLFQLGDGTDPVEFNYDIVGFQTDRTINTNNANQTTGSRKPTYRTNQQNGKPAIHYDGAEDYLEITDPPANPTDNPQFELNDFSIYAVVRRHVTGADHTVCVLQAGDVTGKFSGISFHIFSGNLRVDMAASGSSFVNVRTSGVTIPAGEFHLLSVIKSGTTVEIYIDGVLVPQFTTGIIPATINYDPTAFLNTYIGASSQVAGVTRHMLGDFGPILIYDNGHGDSDRTIVENGLIIDWVLPTGAMRLGTGDSEGIITGDGDGIKLV